MALSVILPRAAARSRSPRSPSLHPTAFGRILVYGGSLAPSRWCSPSRSPHCSGSADRDIGPAARPALDRRAFPPRRARGLLSCRRQSRRRRGEPLSRSATAGTRQAPQRVLPFYPLFLAAMNLVVLADDAFTFLFSWEFMSLSSWALVMAHDQVTRERARRLRLSGDGELRHARRCCSPSACSPGRTAATPSTRSARRHPSAALPRWCSFSC